MLVVVLSVAGFFSVFDFDVAAEATYGLGATLLPGTIGLFDGLSCGDGGGVTDGVFLDNLKSEAGRQPMMLCSVQFGREGNDGSGRRERRKYGWMG